MTIFQLTAEDVDRSSTLEASDIGKWTYIVQGCYAAFFDTEQAAIDSYNQIKRN